MRKIGIGLAIAIASVGAARAADLPTKKGVAAAPVNCFASVWTWLDSTAADCPLSWGPFTVYGTYDIGLGYNTNGAAYNAAWNNGVDSFITNQNKGVKWLWTPNGMSQSVIGLKMSQSLAPLGLAGWSLIGTIETGFNPYYGYLADAQRSQVRENGLPLVVKSANNDSSRAGQWDNSQGFIGVSNKTYGTLTVGRVNALSTDVTSAYDPVRSNAFSLLGFSGAFPGLGASQLTRVNTAVVYRVEYGNFRVAGLAQFGNGYALGNSSMGQYQAQIGATFGGLSVDAVFSYAKDAVTLSSYFDSGLPAGFDPNSILKATLSDNTGLLLGPRYKWDQWEVYGGYTYARL